MECNNEKEFISFAAIRWYDGHIATGKHHNECRSKAKEKHASMGFDSGFVTNLGRFVSRQDAARIAFDAKQVSRFPDSMFNSELIWKYGGCDYVDGVGYVIRLEGDMGHTMDTCNELGLKGIVDHGGKLCHCGKPMPRGKCRHCGELTECRCAAKPNSTDDKEYQDSWDWCCGCVDHSK